MSEPTRVNLSDKWIEEQATQEEGHEVSAGGEIRKYCVICQRSLEVVAPLAIEGGAQLLRCPHCELVYLPSVQS